MVDAQAPGLAGRVRELGAIPAPGRAGRCGCWRSARLLHLLDTAWLGRERLPDPLAATVRTRVGLPMSAEGPPVRDHWLVLAQYDTPDGRLTTRRIWLYGRESGRTALLLSFGAVGRAPELALPVGVTIDAELTPYPGGGRSGPSWGGSSRTPGAGTGHTRRRAARPRPRSPRTGRRCGTIPGWTPGRSPCADVIPVPSGGGWQLADAEGESALPLAPAALSRPGLWKLVALSGGGPVTVFGELGHRGFDPFAAWDTGAGRGRVRVRRCRERDRTAHLTCAGHRPPPRAPIHRSPISAADRLNALNATEGDPMPRTTTGPTTASAHPSPPSPGRSSSPRRCWAPTAARRRLPGARVRPTARPPCWTPPPCTPCGGGPGCCPPCRGPGPRPRRATRARSSPRRPGTGSPSCSPTGPRRPPPGGAGPRPTSPSSSRSGWPPPTGAGSGPRPTWCRRCWTPRGPAPTCARRRSPSPGRSACGWPR